MKKYMGLVLSVLVFSSLFLITGCAPGDVVPFIDKLTGSVGGWMGLTTILTAVVELIVRIWPTANPTSLFTLVASILHSVGALCTTVSQFLDGIIQNSSKDIVVRK